MRFLQIILSITMFSLFYTAKAQTPARINPTGIFNYDGKTVKKNGDTYGYFGTIKVLQIDSNRILMNFFICKGAPSYNSGSFTDTLHYTNNTCVYRGDTTFANTTCRLVFKFSLKGINAELFSEFPNSACGFGHAVDAYGFFKRMKGKIPTKK